MEKSPGILHAQWNRARSHAIHERPAWSVVRKPPSVWMWLYASIAVFCFTSAIYLLRRADDLSSPHNLDIGPANATLGFGAIYAVSPNYSPRRFELERSGDLVGLSFTIPAQPGWSTRSSRKVTPRRGFTKSQGSTLTSLGHLNVLKRFLDSSYETALIVEDDVDFDTHIRTEQIPATAQAVRQILSPQQHTVYYYGDPKMWDLLLLGHCGDIFDKEQASKLPAIKAFTDRNLPNMDELLPATASFLQHIGITEEQQHIVHHSVNTSCIFAYGVTRAAAERLVTECTTRDQSRPRDRPEEALDVNPVQACRDNGFKCFTVTPELFQRTPALSDVVDSSSSSTDDGNSNNNKNSDVDEDSHQDSKPEFTPTPNIRCSARSNLWWKYRWRPRHASGLLAMKKVISELAQSPGICYLDDLV